tara:strand:+ start:11 stop:187 length:177 start_codon:yes stop_codon:yes gene_type:complete
VIRKEQKRELKNKGTYNGRFLFYPAIILINKNKTRDSSIGSFTSFSLPMALLINRRRS